MWIYPAALPSGRRVPMLKVLQASGCERSCAYCVERCGGRGRAHSLPPEALARAFVELLHTRRVTGLFLSSAIRGGAVATMDRMLATAELLRGRHAFRGYIHLKMIPGSRGRREAEGKHGAQGELGRHGPPWRPATWS